MCRTLKSILNYLHIMPQQHLRALMWKCFLHVSPTVGMPRTLSGSIDFKYKENIKHPHTCYKGAVTSEYICESQQHVEKRVNLQSGSSTRVKRIKILWPVSIVLVTFFHGVRARVPTCETKIIIVPNVCWSFSTVFNEYLVIVQCASSVRITCLPPKWRSEYS